MALPLLLILMVIFFPLSCATAEPANAIFDVSAFGAKGDGVTDDTVALRKAILTASESGGVVQLGKGKYRITGSLVINARDVVLKGHGRGISTIWADGTDFHAIVVGKDDNEVRSIALNGFSIERPSRANAEIANIYIARCRYSSIDNIDMNHGGDGVFVGSRTAKDISGCISIKRVWMGGCRRDLVVACAADVLVSHMYAGHSEIGVYLTHVANNVRLTDCVFLTDRVAQGKHGLLSDAGFMQEIKGCVFEETSHEVIKVVGVPRFYFHDNWLNANPDTAMVRLEGVTQFNVCNTRYGGSGTRCVELVDSSRGIVSGNTMESSRGIAVNVIGGNNIEIINNQMGGNDVAGIRLSDGAQSIRISGNHALGSECAIHLTESVGDKLIIKENFLTPGKKGAIIDESKIENKIIRDNFIE